MAARERKNQRLDVRLTDEQKTRLNLASAFENKSISDYIIEKIMPEVENTLKAQQKITLNPEQWDNFVNMINTRKKASPKLKEYIKKHREIQGT